MPVYEPASPELGKNATTPRVNALRELNKAGGAQFKRYERGGTPSYQIVSPAGDVRELQTREVPAYVVGQLDAYTAVLGQLQEALDAAFCNPGVMDRETLIGTAESVMEERIGEHIRRAAGYFVASPEKPVNSIVA